MPAKTKRRKKPAKRSRRRAPSAIRQEINELKERQLQELRMEEEKTLFMKEQTLLAKERTILSFMRTGLTFVTVGFAIVAAGPILNQGYQGLKVDITTALVIGISVVIIGFLEIIESVRRLRIYRSKMSRIKLKLGDDDV